MRNDILRINENQCLFFILNLLNIHWLILGAILAFQPVYSQTSDEAQTHGYHAFGFSELSAIASMRAHGHHVYRDSLDHVLDLQTAIDELIQSPSRQSLETARQAWIDARIPYSHTEVFRFIFPEIDQWEGTVNAWPLDEGLIDYVEINNSGGEDNPYASVNVIANTNPIVNGREIDASTITPELLRDQLHELDSIESNVATGFHAVEFLLWGQDLNGNGPGAGDRPWTDFSLTQCSNGNCDRRIDYLQSAMALLIGDLEVMVEGWSETGFITEKMLFTDPREMIGIVLEGMATFIQAELVSERMQLPLKLGDPEEEHDCFSDQTHNSLYYNLLGIPLILQNQYMDEKWIEPMMLELLSNSVSAYNATNAAKRALQKIVDSAESDNESSLGHFDQLIAQGNDEGNALVKDAITSLNVLSLRLIEVRNQYR